MADHRSKQIVDSITTLVTGLPTAGANVKNTRVYPVGVPAAITIQRGQDTVQQIVGNAFTDRHLEVVVTIHVQAGADNLDDQLALIATETHQAIMADTHLGFPDWVIDTDLIGESEPEISGEPEIPTALIEQRWRVHYRHSLTDPSA